MTEEQGLYIPVNIADNLPAMVRTKLSQMSASQQEHFLEEYNRKTKSTGMAYLAWIIGGWHYGYLGKWGMNLIYWVTLGGVGFWCLLDLCRMSSLVKDYNKDVALAVMRDLHIAT